MGHKSKVNTVYTSLTTTPGLAITPLIILPATETIQLDSVFFKQTKKHSFNFFCLKKRSDSLLFSLIIPWRYVVACSEVYKIDSSLCESCPHDSQTHKTEQKWDKLIIFKQTVWYLRSFAYLLSCLEIDKNLNMAVW